MTQDEIIRRLVATGRVTKRDCTSFLSAAAECGLEVVPRPDGPARAGVVTPSPRPSFSHGRAVVAGNEKSRVVVAAPRNAVSRLISAQPLTKPEDGPNETLREVYRLGRAARVLDRE